MTDAQARQIVLDSGVAVESNVDLLCKNAFGGDMQAFARAMQEPDFDSVQDEFDNVLG